MIFEIPSIFGKLSLILTSFFLLQRPFQYDVLNKVSPFDDLVCANVSGMEFGQVPGKINIDYVNPIKSLDFVKKDGINCVRYPIYAERVDSAYVSQINKFLDKTKILRMKVIIDFRSKGMEETPFSEDERKYHLGKIQFVLKNLKSEVLAINLLNEPRGMDAKDWGKTANRWIYEIRKDNPNLWILVMGEEYGTASRFREVNSELKITDSKTCIEAHQYGDTRQMGDDKESYDPASHSKNTLKNRLSLFVEYIKKKNMCGFIGEIAVSQNDPRWLEMFSEAVAYLNDKNVGFAVWSYSPWWPDDYSMKLDSKSGSKMIKVLQSKKLVIPYIVAL